MNVKCMEPWKYIFHHNIISLFIAPGQPQYGAIGGQELSGSQNSREGRIFIDN